MKIVLICLGYGGVLRYNIGLLKALLTLGQDVTFCFPVKDKLVLQWLRSFEIEDPKAIQPLCQNSCGKTVNISSIFSLSLLRNSALADVLETADVVIVNNDELYPWIYKIAKVHSFKVINVVHGIYRFATKYWGSRSLLLLPYLHMRQKRSAKNSHYVIAVSKHTAHWVNELFGVNYQKIGVVYPVLASVFLKSAPNDLLKFYLRKYADYEKRIVAIGIPSKRKGFDTLFKIVKKLEDKYKSICLILVGKGKWTDIVKVAERSGLRKRVFVEPGVSDEEMLAILKVSDLFAFPSRYEAFGIASIEAQAAGLPVVVSAIGGLPETVIPGKTGYIAKTLDEFIKYIQLLLEDDNLRQRMSRNAKEFVSNTFTHEMIARRYLKPILEMWGLT